MSWSTTVPVDRPVVIVNTLTGKLLGVTDASPGAQGHLTQLFEVSASADPHCQWRIVGVGQDAIGDQLSIVNLATGQFLDGNTDTATLFTDVYVLRFDVPPPPNRVWRIEAGAPGSLSIANIGVGGKLLSANLITLGTPNSAAQLGDTDPTMLTCQWRIVPVEQFTPKTVPPHSFQDAPNGFDLLIVTPTEFAGLFDAFRTAKADRGVRTHLVSLTATPDGRRGVLDNFAGRDHPERIKAAIAVAHREFGAKYVMLVGDASIMPTRMVYNYSNDPTHTATVGDFRPSDLYYANLYHHGARGVVAANDGLATVVENGRTGDFNSWDLNGDNRYNESQWGVSALQHNPDCVDGYPDVVVGRVPARTAGDVQAFLGKVVEYEASAQAIPAPKAWAFLADGAYQGSQSDCDSVRSAIPAARMGSARSELITSSPFGFAEAETLETGWTVADDTTLAQMTGSAWWLAYTGHGGSRDWDYAPAEFDAVSQLHNTTYPIVFAAACSTGAYRGCPPNGGYQDIARMFRWYWGDDNDPMAFTERDPANTVIGSVIGPLTVPDPSGYDLSIGTAVDPGQSSAGRTVACAWLLNPAGGGIAYFGETLVCEDDKGTELHKDLVTALGQLNGTTERSLGDAWLLAQRQYWADNCEYEGSPGSVDPFRHPRVYLGIMTFFGDPSLQLCVPAPPVIAPKPPVLNPGLPIVHPGGLRP